MQSHIVQKVELCGWPQKQDLRRWWFRAPLNEYLCCLPFAYLHSFHNPVDYRPGPLEWRKTSSRTTGHLLTVLVLYTPSREMCQAMLAQQSLSTAGLERGGNDFSNKIKVCDRFCCSLVSPAKQLLWAVTNYATYPHHWHGLNAKNDLCCQM